MHDADTIRGWLAGLPTPSEEIMGENYNDRGKWSRLRGQKQAEMRSKGFGKKGGRVRSPDQIARANGRPTGLTQADINYIRNL